MTVERDFANPMTIFFQLLIPWLPN